MKLVSISVLALSAVMLSACGGSDDEKTNTDNNNTSGSCPGGYETGHQVDTTKVCDLQCGVSTMDQTMQLLGQPDSSGTGGVLIYEYICVEPGQVGSGQTWDFYFDDANVLTKVDLVSIGSFAGEMLPDCFADCVQ